ncbi:DUF1929-domain-containing protein [Exidia glandulosa HHB12029]|uniref:DUF1929-domain-containing protein n=1 Tax=Exidia glandulosa HHB12029 TaxID=1314781 RepID=A0A165P9K0_EXIGL|nr:DUF1929-domain-containing protein [Exidia glandulosa HHB12029]
MPAASFARFSSFLHVLLLLSRGAYGQAPGTFAAGGSTLVSAMMFLGSDDKVYILDKAEANEAQIKGHPAWASVWDIATHKAQLVDTLSNPFCAAGALLPNSSWVTFGGNHAVHPTTKPASGGVEDYKINGGDPGLNPADVYQETAIRVLKPSGCTGDVNNWGPECQWYDDPATLKMMKARWYATAETLGDGTVLLVGGMVGGGYINRNFHSSDLAGQGGMAENTYELYPRRADLTEPRPSNFLANAGGLNTYAHTFTLKSGKVFLQANVSTIILDPSTWEETSLPDMPDGVVRVYPASAGVAMLPLTPANNYNPTILFCGGTNALSDDDWGDYGTPHVDTWKLTASADCRRITPEPEDGSAVDYEKDDDMLDPRTMGQFIILPNGKLLMLNGGKKGTAGYTTHTPDTPWEQLPFGMSLAAEEVLTPAIYDPEAPAGKRWSDEGLAAAKLPRLYHSTAILLPDGSVIIAGSNPNADVVVPNGSNPAPGKPYYTTYDAEIFYPPYFANISSRPVVETAIPKTLTYGGAFFNLTLSNKYDSPNDAAVSAKVVLLRPGFSTHAMNMGQRYMQLNSTYSVSDDGKVTLSVSPPPPNSNLLTPGQVLFFVVVDGVPSVGTHVLVGNGQFGAQPVNAVVELPPNAESRKFSAGGDSQSDASHESGDKEKSGHTAIVIGVAVAAVLVLAIALAIGICYCRRRKTNYATVPIGSPRTRPRDAEMATSQYRDSSYSASFPAAAYRTPGHASGTMSDLNLPPQQPRNYEQFPSSPRMAPATH